MTAERKTVSVDAKRAHEDVGGNCLGSVQFLMFYAFRSPFEQQYNVDL